MSALEKVLQYMAEKYGDNYAHNFQKFFGKSKLVRPDGAPLPLYHGTNDDIEEFASWRRENKKDPGWLGEGFYTSPSPGIASAYPSLKRPGTADGPLVMPLWGALENPLDVDVMSKQRFSQEEAADFTRRAMELGHDGVIARTPLGEISEVNSFYPERLKSAIGNRGTFDRNDPRLTYGSGGSVPRFEEGGVTDDADSYGGAVGGGADPRDPTGSPGNNDDEIERAIERAATYDDDPQGPSKLMDGRGFGYNSYEDYALDTPGRIGDLAASLPGKVVDGIKNIDWTKTIVNGVVSLAANANPVTAPFSLANTLSELIFDKSIGSWVSGQAKKGYTADPDPQGFSRYMEPGGIAWNTMKDIPGYTDPENSGQFTGLPAPQGALGTVAAGAPAPDPATQGAPMNFTMDRNLIQNNDPNSYLNFGSLPFSFYDKPSGYAEGGRVGSHPQDQSDQIPREWLDQDIPWEDRLRLFLEGGGGKNGDGVSYGGGRAMLRIPLAEGLSLAPWAAGGGAYGNFDTPDGNKVKLRAADSDLGVGLRYTIPFAEGGRVFDPEGDDYDYETAIAHGMAPGEDGHWGSRTELLPEELEALGLPPRSGVMLKGRGHHTWGLGEQGEDEAGFYILPGGDGRYYSLPKFAEGGGVKGKVAGALGKLAMDYASRMGRAKDMGMTADVYHGTHADVPSFDSNMVDIGVHVGSNPEQAENRLRDLSNPLTGRRSYGPDKFRSGANTMPLKADLGRSLEMEDVGLWKDSAKLAQALEEKGFATSGLVEDAEDIRRSFEDTEDFLNSPENRELLNELRGMIQSAGYDSVKYKNQVENSYGELTKKLPEVQMRQSRIADEINEIEMGARDRMPQPPELDNPDVDGALRAFLDAKLEDNLLPEERASIERLNAEYRALSEDPANYLDPHSYIVLDPSKLRSRFAAFDPDEADSPDLLKARGGYTHPVSGEAGISTEPQEDAKLDALLAAQEAYRDRPWQQVAREEYGAWPSPEGLGGLNKYLGPHLARSVESIGAAANFFNPDMHLRDEYGVPGAAADAVLIPLSLTTAMAKQTVPLITGAGQELARLAKKVAPGLLAGAVALGGDPSEAEAGGIWRSKLDDLIAKLGNEKGSLPQLRARLANAGVKQEELDWRLKGFGDDAQKPVTLDELRAHLEGPGKIEPDEKVLGDRKGFSAGMQEEIDHLESLGHRRDDLQDARYQFLIDRENSVSAPGERPEMTKFSEYQLPGGENYKEMLLTMPSKGAPNAAIPSDGLRPTRQINTNDFNGGHYSDTPNVLAHVRFNDRTIPVSEDKLSDIEQRMMQAVPDSINNPHSLASGAAQAAVKKGLITPLEAGQYSAAKGWYNPEYTDLPGARGEKVLFLEEVQSDWHQKGRKQGYKGPTDPKLQSAVENAQAQFAAHLRNMDLTDTELSNAMAQARSGTIPSWVLGDPRNEHLATDLIDAWKARDANLGGVPDAPLKKTWPETAMRRMIKYAADNGYDRIAWTTGAQQADRYDLSKQVDAIRVRRNDDGTFVIGMKPTGAREFGWPQEGISEDKLEAKVGKDLAEKIIKQNEPEHDYTGVDLKVGGEGMAGFYDKMLPTYAGKFGKPHGAKVEPVEFHVEGSDGRDNAPPGRSGKAAHAFQAHSLAITPKLREAVKDGVPFFGAAPMAVMPQEEE